MNCQLIRLCAMTLIILFNLIGIRSAPASPHGFKETQPDGTTTPLVFLHGDHRHNYITDRYGYTIIQNDQGWFVYAELENDDLRPTDFIIGQADPKSLNIEKHITSKKDRTREEMVENEPKRKGNIRGVMTGEDISKERSLEPYEYRMNGQIRVMKNLVILMKFNDHEDRPLPTADDIGVLMNHEGAHDLAPTGSVADVYKKNSYGKLSVESTVLDWITISKTEAECADSNYGYTEKLVDCMVEAIKQNDDLGVSFDEWDADGNGHFDGIMIMHSGYAAEWGDVDCSGQHWTDRIWSHKWTLPSRYHQSFDEVTFSKYHITSALWNRCGNQIARIGAIAHELGHFMGLPDLYDTDNTSHGAGNYDLMANMWGWRGNQWFPPMLSCWTKMQNGWVEPEELTESGEYLLPNSADYPTCYKVSKGYPEGEYLLIENRYATSFDTFMPGGGGIAIWKIDENIDSFNEEGYPGQSSWPENGHHYKVALLQADGNYHLEKNMNRGDIGDLYREGDVLLPWEESKSYPNSDSYKGGQVKSSGVRITDISTIAEVMRFTLTIEEQDHSEDMCVDDPTYFMGKEGRDCEWVKENNKCKKCKGGVCAKYYCLKSCGCDP